MQKKFVLSGLAFAFATMTLSVPVSVHASTYPVNKCVGAKMRAAGAKCKALLKAEATFDSGGGLDAVKRQNARDKAALKFSGAWTKANDNAAKKSVDCADTTLSDVDMETLIDNAVAAITAAVNTGLTLSNSDHAKCGGALLKAASSKCDAFLKAEAGYVAKLAAGHTKRDASQTKATDKFTTQATKALSGSCPTSATVGSLETLVDDLSAAVVTNTTNSPNVDDTQFSVISPAQFPGVEYNDRTYHPICSFTTPYHFFVKRGSVNKLVMYYQGGGACWDFLTCGFIGTFDKEVIPNGTCGGGSNDGELCDTLADCPDQGGGTSCDPGSDNPNHTTTGLGDLTNPDNPFKDWNIVFVSYCTGDIHFGDSEHGYSGGMLGFAHIEHRGYQNARVAEKWAREHFVSPDEVFVTGSSAGAYGAFFNAPLHHDVWPDSKFSVLADAGNGIITTPWFNAHFPTWSFEANLPTNIPGVIESIQDSTGIPAFTKAVADFFPDTAWAQYTSSYDGGTGGQTGFYNVMVNDTTSPGTAAAEWPTWWEESCAWNTIMRAQAQSTAAAVPSNYRYYIGTGSRHTMYGSNKVYTDTSGGVPTIVDWINSMRARDGGWTNVECSSDCGLLQAGDPRPSPLEAPFEASGPDVVVNCP